LRARERSGHIVPLRVTSGAGRAWEHAASKEKGTGTRNVWWRVPSCESDKAEEQQSRVWVATERKAGKFQEVCWCGAVIRSFNLDNPPLIITSCLWVVLIITLIGPRWALRLQKAEWRFCFWKCLKKRWYIWLLHMGITKAPVCSTNYPCHYG